jgi:hypothetical protein
MRAESHVTKYFLKSHQVSFKHLYAGFSVLNTFCVNISVFWLRFTRHFCSFYPFWIRICISNMDPDPGTIRMRIRNTATISWEEPKLSILASFALYCSSINQNCYHELHFRIIIHTVKMLKRYSIVNQWIWALKIFKHWKWNPRGLNPVTINDWR